MRSLRAVECVGGARRLDFLRCGVAVRVRNSCLLALLDDDNAMQEGEYGDGAEGKDEHVTILGCQV